MESKKIDLKFFLKGNPFKTKKVFMNQISHKRLTELRQDFVAFLSDDIFFLKDGCMVGKEDEDEYLVREILNDNIIYLLQIL